MRIEALIVTRDRADALRTALESALRQDYPDARVVVFDDGSTDETGSLRGEYPRAHWHRSNVHVGCIAARNQWLRESTADAVCLLDDDAHFLCDDALSQAAECFRSDDRVGAVAFDVISPGRDGRRPRGSPWPAHAFPGCGCVLRMDAVREIGYFPEGPGEYGSEEKDMSLRLLDGGYDIRFLPGVTVWHDRAPLGRSYAAQHASGVCNDMAWVLRRFPMPMVMWWLPAKAVGNLRFSLKNGLSMRAIEGLARFATAIPCLVRERRAVRRETLLEFWNRQRRFPDAMASVFPVPDTGNGA